MKRPFDVNILVISDLHLGEDLRPAVTGVSYLRRLVVLERELVAFLRHYTSERRNGRPWRLVVNGDMVDFMSIQILASEAADADQRRYGLGHGEAASAHKLDRVIERHEGVFRALADFVAAGNELVVVVGNHDVEFHYSAVQQRMIDALADRGAARERIRFCDWFYYEEEVVYVEHGHQYDEYCSFDYQLHPVERERGVTLSIAHAGVRYFTNAVPSMDPHCAEAWGFFDYVRWAWAHGARGMARLALLYGGFVRNLFEIWALLTDRGADAERAGLHRARLATLSKEYRLAAGQIEALDALKQLPVLKQFHKIFVATFLDRMLLGLLVLAAVATVLICGRAPGHLATVALLVGGGLVGNRLLARLRFTNSATLLRRAPEAIRAILKAPFIVFGHSHLAEEVELADGARYFNTGTWLSALDEGRDDSGPAFTHLIIAGEGDPVAGLYEWRDGGSSKLGSRS